MVRMVQIVQGMTLFEADRFVLTLEDMVDAIALSLGCDGREVSWT